MLEADRETPGPRSDEEAPRLVALDTWSTPQVVDGEVGLYRGLEEAGGLGSGVVHLGEGLDLVRWEVARRELVTGEAVVVFVEGEGEVELQAVVEGNTEDRFCRVVWSTTLGRGGWPASRGVLRPCLGGSSL